MITKDGFDFGFDESKCAECGGQCCIGDGYVFLEVDECAKIAAFLGLSLDEFGLKYLRKVGNRYALISDNRDECVFLGDEGKCQIYHLRPRNCRTFPFWEVFRENPQGAFRECMGVVEK